MTIIVIRDGVMACDTLVTGDGFKSGNVRKWGKVHTDIGGGFCAFGGSLGKAKAALDCMADRQKNGFSVDAGIWIREDGVVLEKYDEDDWFSFDAGFYAIGSGDLIAIGALAMGATAQEAVEVCIEMSMSCGGSVGIAS